jgi:acetyl esterase/lipase
VTDATKAMVASGLIDPKRIAIMGTSFGGFLALSGAAYEPDLYRCAAAISAVSDWSKLIADYRYNKYSNAYFSRMVYKLGDPSKDPEKWDAISPSHRADKIRAAVFIANGEYDAPMAISCSKELASIVSRNNIPVEPCRFKTKPAACTTSGTRSNFTPGSKPSSRKISRQSPDRKPAVVFAGHLYPLDARQTGNQRALARGMESVTVR